MITFFVFVIIETLSLFQIVSNLLIIFVSNIIIDYALWWLSASLNKFHIPEKRLINFVSVSQLAVFFISFSLAEEVGSYSAIHNIF